MSKPTLAGAIANALRAADTTHDDGGLVTYASRLARRREGARALPMHHLGPLARSYEAAEGAIRSALAGQPAAPIFEAHHAPVQHGKTTLIQANVLRTLRRNPRAWIAYCAYNESTAVAKMYEVRQLAEGEGIHVDPSFDTATEWRTREGGGVISGGIVGGPWTSRGFDLIVIDDPYKTAQDAYSAAWRTSVENAFWTALWTRRRPWTSIIVNAARWHPNDLTGALVKRRWRYVRLPAISADGRALWPERWALEELLAIRDGRPAADGREAIDPVPATVWASLYQGDPRPEGSKVFDPAHLVTYDELPAGAYVEAMGADYAYGARSRHDRSAIVCFRRYAHDPRALYLVEAWLGHEAIELAACRTAEMQLRRGAGVRLALPRDAADIEMPGPHGWRSQLSQVAHARRLACRWYTSTTEAGAAALMAGYGAQVQAIRAAVDKLARAQAGGYTAAWAEGRVRWPARPGAALDLLRTQHEDFTGAEGDEDDGVDAAVAAHDLLALPAASLADDVHAYAAGRDPWLSEGGGASAGQGMGGGWSGGWTGSGESWE